MRQRELLTLTACLLLQGCQPPGYDILGEARGGRLVFLARGAGSWGDEDIDARRVEIRDSSQIVWAIEADVDGCRANGATPPFPLTYNRVPRCYREVVPAKRLALGVLYRIDGHGLRWGSGYFRLDPRVLNFEWEEVEAELAGWPALPDPRMGKPVQDNSSTAAAPAAADSKAVSATRP